MLTTLDTEQLNPLYRDLDCQDTLEIARMMNAEDRTVPEAVAKILPSIARAVDAVVERMQAGGRLFYAGAGTSGRLGVLDAAECPPTFGVSVDLVQSVLAGGKDAVFAAVEDAEDDEELAGRELAERGLTSSDIVVGIAASGRTPFSVGALRYAKRAGALTVSLSCNAKSTMSNIADFAIEVRTGPEILAGSTRLKAGTAQKMVLNMLSTITMIRLGKTYHNFMVDLHATNSKLIQRARSIVMQATGVSYEVADETLVIAQGNVKRAIVMIQKDVGPEEADKLLKQSNGFLRKALSC